MCYAAGRSDSSQVLDQPGGLVGIYIVGEGLFGGKRL